MTKDDDPFYEYYARESLSESTLERFRGTKSAIIRAARQFGFGEGPWRVADIGCGAGTQSTLWARDGHIVYGLDINERLVELARSRAAADGLSIDFRAGTALRLPWPDHSMDICICPELIEHVPDWQTCVLEAGRVLKSGGLLYLSTTNKLCPIQEEFLLPMYSWYPKRLKRHYERLAVTTRPELVAHTKFPAVNWFTYFGLRDFLVARGFACGDRFDVAARTGQGRSVDLILRTIRAFPPVRWLAHVFTPYTVVFATKTA